jgi:YD repeat-containing protein
MLTLNDSVGNTTNFAYDGIGRMTMETNELNKSRSFEYNLAGNLARRTDRNGQVIQYQHDNLERTTQESWYANASATPNLSITVDTEAGQQNEVQRVGFKGTVFGGTFKLTAGASTTSSLAHNATAAQVQAALEALPSIGSGNVSVVRSYNSQTQTTTFTLTFQSSLAATNVAQTTINTSTLSGYGITKVEATDVQGGVFNEVQTIDLNNAIGGKIRLAFNGETTAALNYDATAAQVDAALEELNSIDQVTVTGSAGGPWTVTFIGAHSGINVPSIMGDSTDATCGALIHTISYEFDQASRLTAVEDQHSAYTYSYDNLGRLLTVDNGGTPGVPQVVLNSTYDASGNRTSLSATIGSTQDFFNTYSYDLLNRLTQVQQAGVSGGNVVAEKRVDFTYHDDSRVHTIARYNDTTAGSAHEIATSTYSFDSLGRLSELSYKQGSTNLFTPYSWTYDDVGRITQFSTADGTSDYDYDQTDQLIAANHNYQSDESYSYDANGNRTGSGYTTGNDNRLTHDGTFSYTYDHEGNRTSRTNDSTNEQTLYEWDHRNRLISVTEKDDQGTTTQVVEYTYDVYNRRIGKAIDTTAPFSMADAAIERYVFDDLNGVTSVDGGNVVLDFVDPDGDGSTSIALERRQLYSNTVDQILAQENLTESISSADRVYWCFGSA